MDLPSLGSHMGLPLPEPSQNRCCLWNQNSTIIHGIKPLRRLTPPPRPFRGGQYFAIIDFSPERGDVTNVTEGFQPTNNNLPTYKRTQQAAVLPPDEAFPKATRLTVAYNLQASQYRKVTSADYCFPSPQRQPATAMCRRHTSYGEAVFHGALRYFTRRRRISFYRHVL